MNQLPKEVKCKILSYLSIRDICKMNLMSKNWKIAVECYLSFITEMSFEGQEKFNDNYATKMTDEQFKVLLHRCPLVEMVKGFHPEKVMGKSRGNALTEKGVVAALALLPRLKSMELSDFGLLAALRLYLPKVVVPLFQNRNGVFPCFSQPSYCLSAHSVQELELFGVTLSSLPSGLKVSKLHLQCVTFEKPILRNSRFILPQLKSFMMNYCHWPVEKFSQTNVSLCAGLASARHLELLHLTCASIDPRLIKRIIEANWMRVKPFSNLKKLVLSSNCSLVEDDIGALLIASQRTLENLYIQKTLSKDMMMVALETAHPYFWSLKHLKLGYVDELSPRDLYGEAGDFNLIMDERPCQLSDSGMRAASSAFLSPDLVSLSINECAYLCNAVNWIPERGIESSIWSGLTELTLSRCSTVQLAHFNAFVVQLCSLKVLSLCKMFPPPPKGCSRVGLSAGMNIGGPSGIRAIISQPPALAPSSLLNASPFSESELEQMLAGRVEESEGEDTVEPADVAQGYRADQVHTSCMTTKERIRRSAMRSAQQQNRQKPPTPSPPAIDISRRPRRQSAVGCRASLRLKGRRVEFKADPPEEIPRDEPPREEELIISIPRNLIRTRNSDAERLDPEATAFSDPLPSTSGGSRPSVNNRQSLDARVKPTLCDSGSDSDEMAPQQKDNRCHLCGKPQPVIRSGSLSSPSPSNRHVQIHRNPSRAQSSGSSEATGSLKLCRECVKRQWREAKRHHRNPNVDVIKPSKTQHEDVDHWLVFDTSSGLGRLRTAHSHAEQAALFGPSGEKGKAPAKHSATSKAKGHRNHYTASSGQSSIPCNRGENKESGPPSSKRRRKGKEQGDGERRNVGRDHGAATLTADKETHTRDPFIEDDTVQVLTLDQDLPYLQCVNIVQCGLTHISLKGCTNLRAVTAHACLVLSKISFSSYPALRPNLARISQCPKMDLPGLLENINNKDVMIDNQSSEYVRTVEFEPMLTYDREETLLELSAFPEVNKVLVECHTLGTPSECVRLKTYYESLLKEMSSDGNASYKSSPEYRIYTDVECEKEIIVAHNIPSCSTKITPYCRGSGQEEGACEVTSAQGHTLRGRTILCFVYPLDHWTHR